MIETPFFAIISSIDFRKKRGYKMIKKLICVLLCAVICLPMLSGCGQDDETPDGMFSSTIDGEPFILYVPDGWTDNCKSGISSAYYALNVIVSARYYTLKGENATIDAFVDAHIAERIEIDSDFAYTRKEAKLGKEKDAIRVEYDFDNGLGSDAKAIQYFAEHNGDVVMLSFYCESSSFDEYAETFEQIRNEFVLRDKTVINEVITDKKTPEGMKLASGDVQYRFYVPNGWIANVSDGFSSAYYPESGKPNVSVTTYSPSEEMDIETYFRLCEEEYKKTLSGYEFIGSSERTVHDEDAVCYVYKTIYGGVELKLMQVVFLYNDLFYSITYTAHADRFDAHTDDVEQMLDEFRFR